MASAASANRNWEGVFCTWGGAPSAAEQQKCENAERAIRKAIAASSTLSTMNIKVFAQGSYANRTNVREDNNVDIYVLCRDPFFTDYTLSEGLNDAALGYSDYQHHYPAFKNDVEEALKSYFGAGSVTRGNRAFAVHAHTDRLDAEVVPCFEHRRVNGTPQSNWIDYGIRLIPDQGSVFVNWPRQNYRNGENKNDTTGLRFKAIVRILKRLCNEMLANGHKVAEQIPSYLIECLVWNVPNTGFGHDSYQADVRYVIAYLWNETLTDDTCKEWREINELEYLFRASQPWQPGQVNAFFYAAQNYIGFK
jgi:hypothetical protein